MHLTRAHTLPGVRPRTERKRKAKESTRKRTQENSSNVERALTSPLHTPLSFVPRQSSPPLHLLGVATCPPGPRRVRLPFLGSFGGHSCRCSGGLREGRRGGRTGWHGPPPAVPPTHPPLAAGERAPGSRRSGLLVPRKKHEDKSHTPGAAEGQREGVWVPKVAPTAPDQLWTYTFL